MPFVKWKKGNVDITPEDEIPVGRNVLELTNILNSANYTCIAASTLGQIEASAVVKVQCKWCGGILWDRIWFLVFVFYRV